MLIPGICIVILAVLLSIEAKRRGRPGVPAILGARGAFLAYSLFTYHSVSASLFSSGDLKWKFDPPKEGGTAVIRYPFIVGYPSSKGR